FYSEGELQKSALESQYGDEDSYSTVHKAYANTGAKIVIDKHRTVKLNWLLRYTNSELYHENPAPLFWANYPNHTIARNMFKLRKVDEDKYAITESTLNQFSYRWQDEESSVTLGRMFIKYGEGFTFNPINPFNYPTHFSSLRNIDQGNDGLKISLKMQ